VQIRVLNLFLLAVIGISLAFSANLMADDIDQDTLNQVHDLLHQAWGGDADTPPTNTQRVALLKQAQKILDTIPPGHHHHHLVNARKFIDAALIDLANGDPANAATDDIRSADDEVRSLD